MSKTTIYELGWTMLSKSVILFFFFIAVARAGTIFVTSTADTGNGTLNWAIRQANQNSGADTIAFNLLKSDPLYKAGGKYWEIKIKTTLPFFTDDSTFLDGDSQSRNSGVDNPNGLEIMINGSAAPFEVSGFHVFSAYNKIRGLSIGGFRHHQIEINGTKAHHNRVEKCYLGLLPDGKGKYGRYINKSTGIQMTNGAHSNVIGGVSEELRNVITNMYFEAVEIYNKSHHNQVIGNYIGTKKDGIDTTGTVGNGWKCFPPWIHIGPAVPCSDGLPNIPKNRHAGIIISADSYKNSIGGEKTGEGNIIVGSGRSGIEIRYAGADSNLILGNYIGLAVDGETVIPNYEAGIRISDGAAYNRIGGTTDGARNVISGNKSSNIQLRWLTHHNQILGNYIGTNATATRTLVHSHNGIYIFPDTSKPPEEGAPYENEIGPDNIIIANGDEGDEKTERWASVRIDGPGTRSNRIFKNHIGTDPTGTLSSDLNSGVILWLGTEQNVIGPDNVIAHHEDYGIWIRDLQTRRNVISQNRIYNNREAQIFIDKGAQDGILPPTILHADSFSVAGRTIPFGRVELFSGANNFAQHFEAFTIADENGGFEYSGALQGPMISATTTDALGNTSALSLSGTIPVELASFHASASGQTVLLQWMTATESNNYGFYIERSVNHEDFETIAFVPGSGTTQQPRFYQYVDRVNAHEGMRYRLRQVDTDGRTHFSEALSVRWNLPRVFTLLPPYPNPFNAQTVLQFHLTEDSHIALQIYNLHGQRVRTLLEGIKPSGFHTLIWDGKDDSGFDVPTGTYFVRLVSREGNRIQKVMLLR